MPPVRREPFVQSQRSQVWQSVVSALQSDPVLHSAVSAWRVWDGSEDDLRPLTEEDQPSLSMTPTGGTQRWLDENSQECRMTWEIELGVQSTDITHIFDFWAQVEVALFTGNNLLDEIIPYNVIQKTITAPAVSPRVWGAKAGLAAKGTLTILMRINS